MTDADKKPLWSDDKSSEDIDYFANSDSYNVIYNLHEDILCLQEENEQLKAELVTAKAERNELLSLIYNTAIGQVAMGMPVNCEELAEHAFNITGINAEQLPHPHSGYMQPNPIKEMHKFLNDNDRKAKEQGE